MWASWSLIHNVCSRAPPRCRQGGHLGLVRGSRRVGTLNLRQTHGYRVRLTVDTDANMPLEPWLSVGSTTWRCRRPYVGRGELSPVGWRTCDARPPSSRRRAARSFRADNRWMGTRTWASAGPDPLSAASRNRTGSGRPCAAAERPATSSTWR